MNQYLRDLIERVVASFAGGALSVLGLDAVNVLSVDWKAALGVGGGAAVVALLKGFVARTVGNSNSAALAPRARL
jgi:hypothetical protein